MHTKQGLRIDWVNETALDEVAFLTVAANDLEPSAHALPIFTGRVSGLPGGISALVVASDLQGVVMGQAEQVLLGEYLADELAAIFEVHFPAIDRAKVLVLLCGDLYGSLLKRGQSGNPIGVFKKFSSAFGHVIGIAGNHDDFGGEEAALRAIPNLSFITHRVVEVGGLRVGGLSGIIGRPDKPHRIPESAYLSALARLLKQSPDVLLTHLSPAILAEGYQGDERLNEVLVAGFSTLLFCGHSRWPTSQPMLLTNNTQVLNADTKAYILLGN